MNNSFSEIQEKIRSIDDWPKKGVIFRDIATLMYDGEVFQKLIHVFVERYRDKQLDAIVGIDARGFIIGAPVAYELGIAFVPVRKKGKLPGETISAAYALEYGEAEVEIQIDAFPKGARVLLLDDLIATGGTMLATKELLDKMEADILEATAIIDLPDIGGSSKLRQAGLEVHTFCAFDGE